MTIDCVIVQPIDRAGVDLMRQAGLSVFEAPSPALEVLRGPLRTARAVITRDQGLSAEAIAAAPNLALIASHGTGTDRIALEAARRRGIRVVNTPGTNARSVAEHALAMVFACARHLPAADLAVRQGDWALRNRLQSVEISGRTLGLLGYGHVAAHLARMALGLGLHVLCKSNHTPAEVLAADGVEAVRDIDALLSASDIVSLHRHPSGTALLDEERLRVLRPGAMLVNTARGNLIDEAALATALRHGRLAAAALDVFQCEPLPLDSPLLDCPNLVLSPHIGGSSIEAMQRTALEVARQVIERLSQAMPG